MIVHTTQARAPADSLLGYVLSYQIFQQALSPGDPPDNSYINFYRARLAASLTEGIIDERRKPHDGLFAPACLAHCLAFDSSDSAIGGVTHAQALGGWYFNRSRAGGWKLLDNSSSTDHLSSCSGGCWVETTEVDCSDHGGGDPGGGGGGGGGGT